MSDKAYRHPIHDQANHEVVPVTLRDESDGTYAPVERARLEVWDGTGWIKLRANAKGQLLVDRGNAGADTPIRAHYTTVQSGTVLVAATTAQTIHVTAILVAVSNAVTVNPAVSLSLGGTIVASHPGVAPGGGFAWSDLDISASAGDDLTVSCDTPTNGSIDVSATYWMET